MKRITIDEMKSILSIVGILLESISKKLELEVNFYDVKSYEKNKEKIQTLALKQLDFFKEIRISIQEIGNLMIETSFDESNKLQSAIREFEKISTCINFLVQKHNQYVTEVTLKIISRDNPAVQLYLNSPLMYGYKDQAVAAIQLINKFTVKFLEKQKELKDKGRMNAKVSKRETVTPKDPMLKILLINSVVYAAVVLLGIPLFVEFFNLGAEGPSLISLFIVYAVYMIVVICIGFYKRCQKCNKTYALKLYNAEVLEQFSRMKNVTRTDHHYNSKGENVGSTVRHETVPVTVTKQRNYFRCKYCSNVQTSISEHETGA